MFIRDGSEPGGPVWQDGEEFLEYQVFVHLGVWKGLGVVDG